MSRGGKRVGAGRPKKYSQREMFGASSNKTSDAAATIYESAQDYLDAVVAGHEPADPIRVAAAKALLPFQQPRTRVPLASSTKPRDLAKQQSITEQRTSDAGWQKTSDEIRARHAHSTDREN